MLVYYFVPFIVSNRYLLFWVPNGHNSVTVQNRTHVYVNFFDHKDLGNHLLQLCPKVVKHPVYRWHANSEIQDSVISERVISGRLPFTVCHEMTGTDSGFYFGFARKGDKRCFLISNVRTCAVGNVTHSGTSKLCIINKLSKKTQANSYPNTLPQFVHHSVCSYTKGVNQKLQD